MSTARKRILVPTAVVAFLAGAFAPADFIAQIIVALSAFAGTLGILLLCLRFLSLPAWPGKKQWLFAWAIAVAIGGIVSLLPQLVPFAFFGGLAMILLWWLIQKGTAQPDASPNGGPALHAGDSGVSGGPPSVS